MPLRLLVCEDPSVGKEFSKYVKDIGTDLAQGNCGRLRVAGVQVCQRRARCFPLARIGFNEVYFCRR
jgi:hypothetical protein